MENKESILVGMLIFHIDYIMSLYNSTKS